MQVWSTAHYSCWTFVLLIWSGIIRMAHDQRRYALRSSPFLPAYGNILLVLSFFAGLNISLEEFFPTIPQSVLIGSGLEPYRLPSMPLGMKVGIPHFLVPQLGEPALEKNKTSCTVLYSPSTCDSSATLGMIRGTNQNCLAKALMEYTRSLACMFSASEDRPPAQSSSCC